MKTLVILILIGLNSVNNTFNTYSQSFKQAVGQEEQVVVQGISGQILIVEYNGTDLEIETDGDYEVPEKAKGLKPIGSNGATDNTGLGLMVASEGSKIIVTGVTKQSSEGKYTIKIPKGLNCKIDYKSPFADDDISIEGFSSELEISTLNSDINIEKVTGPLLLNSINGEINIKFVEVNQDAPISVTAINGDIDVEIPSNTPANLNLNSLMGEVYTDFDIDFKKADNDKGLTYIGGGRDIKGEINGGGVDIMFKTINNNIYLRKK